MGAVKDKMKMAVFFVLCLTTGFMTTLYSLPSLLEGLLIISSSYGCGYYFLMVLYRKTGTRDVDDANTRLYLALVLIIIMSVAFVLVKLSI